MRVYKEKSGNFIQQTSLWESLGLSHLSHGIISLVGGGGKTSVMYRLAGELEAMGRRVIVTTSTHVFYPKEYQTVVIADASELADIKWERGILVVGGSVVGRFPEEGGTGEKLSGLDKSVIHHLLDFCDILLIEADGAKCLPVKMPEMHEPVIIDETDDVIACVGLDCIGLSWEESCFRWELAAKLWWMIKGETLIKPEDVAAILVSPHGARKCVGRRNYHIVLNKADDGARLACALRVCEILKQHGEMETAVTCFLET